MKRLIIIIIIIVAIFAGYEFLKGGEISTKGLDLKIKSYVESAPNFGACNGVSKLTFLDKISLGEFSKEFGGWPVYANYEIKCETENGTVTYDGRNNANKKVALVFVKKTSSGNVAVFVPEIFSQANADIQKVINDAFNR